MLNFSGVWYKHSFLSTQTGKPSPFIAEDVYEIIMENKEVLNSAIVSDRDFEYEYFGFKTLERSYLMRVNGKPAERPQQMIMRVAIGIHKSVGALRKSFLSSMMKYQLFAVEYSSCFGNL